MFVIIIPLSGLLDWILTSAHSIYSIMLLCLCKAGWGLKYQIDTLHQRNQILTLHANVWYSMNIVSITSYLRGQQQKVACEVTFLKQRWYNYIHLLLFCSSTAAKMVTLLTFSSVPLWSHPPAWWTVEHISSFHHHCCYGDLLSIGNVIPSVYMYIDLSPAIDDTTLMRCREAWWVNNTLGRSVGSWSSRWAARWTANSLGNEWEREHKPNNQTYRLRVVYFGCLSIWINIPSRLGVFASLFHQTSRKQRKIVKRSRGL